MTGRYNLKVSDFARTLARASDAVESKRLGHAECVAHLAYWLGVEEGVSPEGRQTLLLAGLFHDLGWVFLAAEVARLGEGQEGSALRQHPCHAPLELSLLAAEHMLLSGQGLQPLGLPPAVGDAISMMHEHWDGSGLPDGLAQSQIPDLALILATADHIVTLLDEHLGRPDLPPDALRGLARFSGTRLDPDLVELGQSLLSGDGWSRISVGTELEALLDEALYPLYGDFLDLSSEPIDQWADFIGSLADRFHPAVPDHSGRVKAVAGTIAREMGLSLEEAREIEIGACLAEVGRMGLPAPLVFRLGPYTEDERELLRAYPTLSERILAPLRPATPIYRAALTHREKLNGAGYPEGLRGDEIPIGGRILAVADAFVALSADSPQRSGHSLSVSLSILQAQSAELFDGLVVDALETSVNRGL